MTRQERSLRRLAADQTGQTTVEYMLLLACFALPMIWVIRMLLDVIAEYYRMVSFLETLPYP